TTAPVAVETSSPAKSFKWWNFVAGKPANFQEAVKRGGAPKIGFLANFEPPHLDPTASSSFAIPLTVGPVYSRLVRGKYATEMDVGNNPGFEMAAARAESWTSSPDKTEWTFKLRQGVKWQNLPPVNGRELVADDVVFSYNLYKKSPLYAALWVDVDRIEAPDKYTVKIGLKEAVAYFPRVPLTYNYMMILPKEVADKDGDFKKTAIGTGAFSMKEWVPKTSMT